MDVISFSKVPRIFVVQQSEYSLACFVVLLDNEIDCHASRSARLKWLFNSSSQIVPFTDRRNEREPRHPKVVTDVHKARMDIL
jgi:hypothetical protein